MELKGLILVVDDEADISELLAKKLTVAGYKVEVARNGREGLDKVSSLRPDLILLDVVMPGHDGLWVKQQLNENEFTANVPVIFLTAKSATHDKVTGLGLHADDYVTKPFQFAELLARIEAILERRRYYENLSMTDGLTGLQNVHAFKKHLRVFFEMSKRYKRTFSLAVVDIDNLKAVNDRYGHRAGDFAIRTVADVMKQTFRQPDILLRYGGDEFAIILPESSTTEAWVALKRFREKFEDQAFHFEDSREPIKISLSIGMAAYSDLMESEEELFERADKNMYEDKHARGPSRKRV